MKRPFLPNAAAKPLRISSLALAVLLGCGLQAAHAEETDAAANPADLPEADQAIKAKPDNQWTGWWNRSTLLGDMGGLRSALGRQGVTLGLTEASEYLRNVSGGVKYGGDYQGLSTLTLGLDTQRAGWWNGGSFNVSVLDIHGKAFTADHVGSIQSASGIEADRATRLWEAWFQQQLNGERLDVKIGQQSLDQEFMVTQYGGAFIGTMFGWPAVPSADLPAGGPAYPLSGLGVRLRGKLGDNITLLGGAFAGDPTRDVSQNPNDPQQLNKYGTTFSRHGGTLFIGEMQYGRNLPSNGAVEAPRGAAGVGGLPGTYKLGFWYLNQKTADSRMDVNGQPIALTGANPQLHSGNYSIYAVADQTVWRPAEDSTQTLNVFTRLMGAPGDRNLVSFSANAGVTLTAPFAGRDNDTVGLAVGYVKVGNHAAGNDADTGIANGNLAYPVRSDETQVEATYIYQLTPWWQWQADLQYVRNVSAGAVSPNDPTQTQRIPNNWVVGLKTTITF
ncbi:carbohydrate porin [Chromobacterium subtsugae]|uniref:carbohydrate porin n=1 Tax=Chromobacterium subtsugae TaxID=251747 RepID=UPI0009B9B286|nr:carbohydrate porin [Chromobacterium subtsugae]